MSSLCRVSRGRLACTGLALALAVSSSGCRRFWAGSERTTMADVEANLEQLINVTKAGLDLEVSPRFLTFGPLPSSLPWEAPVPLADAHHVHGQAVTLKAGRDGLLRERYEARACPLREIWSCVELWATGRFGKNGDIACVGLRLEKGDTIEKRTLDLRTGDSCPFMTSSPGPAQQVLRGLEKAHLEHVQRQETQLMLDSKAK